jgi:hypothetical protein
MLKRFWGTKKTARPEEKLDAVKQDKAEAERLLAAAQETFDAGQTKENLAALREAKSAFDDACLALESAERNLKKAQAERAEATKARDLAEADDTASKVCHAGVIDEATERAQRCLDLHVQLAELARDNADRARELAGLATRATSLRERHGVTDHVDDRSSMIGSDILLADLVYEHARTLPAGDARRQYLLELVHRLAPSQLGGHRMVPRPERAEATA